MGYKIYKKEILNEISSLLKKYTLNTLEGPYTVSYILQLISKLQYGVDGSIAISISENKASYKMYEYSFMIDPPSYSPIIGKKYTELYVSDDKELNPRWYVNGINNKTISPSDNFINHIVMRQNRSILNSNSDAIFLPEYWFGTIYIYVPSSLVNTTNTWLTSHKTSYHRLTYYVRPLEDYTVDGTITGRMDEDKMGLTT